MHTIRNHKAKVDFIYRFLLNGSSDSQDQDDTKYYLIIIGKGGTGKTTALNEALDKSNELDNIHIWNEGEQPYLINFNSSNNLYIFIRHEDDNFVKCLQNEFDCVTVQFEADDLIIEQT
jgi:Cdc6-like AAA superfamily ATPase